MTLEDAIIFAMNAHKGQVRKGKNTPYIFHPLEALFIAKSLTSNTNVLMASVLHDVIEDTAYSYDDIVNNFGKEVANIINYESEDKMEDKSPEDTWKIRKIRQLSILRNAPYEAKVVCLADKLANMREIYSDYAVIGDELFKRFNNKNKSEQAWYYTEFANILKDEFNGTRAYEEYCNLLSLVGFR